MSTPTAQPGVPAGAMLIDVRNDDEWAAGHAPGATHIPLPELPDRLGEIPPATPVVAVCHSGVRSARAAAFLTAQGYDAHSYEGGMVTWRDVGGELVSENGRPPTVD